MINLEKFSIGYGSGWLLENTYTDFPSNTLTALIGKNGSGKSTLLKAICGLNFNYQGEIFINGKNLRNKPREALAKELSYVNTQKPKISNLKCRDVVALGRTPYTSWLGRLSKKDEEIISEALSTVGMESYENINFNNLSDGESQKIMIARAIAQDTKIIILDEPTSFLDLPTRFELARILKNLSKNKGKTIIFSTHELDIALKTADYISLIDERKLINLGVPEMIEYLKSGNHPFSPFLY